MLIVGLTGGIGSGKSTVGKMFQTLGTPVIDADEVGHRLVEHGKPALEWIAEAFGQDMLKTDGTLNRTKLREVVFADDTKREKLESILHPLIKAQILEDIKRLADDYCIVVVPLLIEKHWTDFVDRILVVDSPEPLQKQRARQRDNLTEAQVSAILKSQASRQTRLDAADDVIDNTGDLAQLTTQVLHLHEKYRKIAQTK
jgi:dephospho-CoA kinase